MLLLFFIVLLLLLLLLLLFYWENGIGSLGLGITNHKEIMKMAADWDLSKTYASPPQVKITTDQGGGGGGGRKAGIFI